jgi:peptide/nickel transport system ATP-binding protein
MYLGEIVEVAESDELFSNPLHPYTVTLLLAAPVPDPDVMERSRRALNTAKPSTGPAPAGGCPLLPRCPVGAGRPDCAQRRPRLREVVPGHQVACHFPGEMREQLARRTTAQVTAIRSVPGRSTAAPTLRTGTEALREEDK